MRTSTLGFSSLLLLGACAHEMSGSTMAINGNERIDKLAEVACDRYAACSGYGNDKEFHAVSDCRQAYRFHAAQAWTDCPQGRMNQASFDACVESVKTLTCSQEIWNGTLASGMCANDKVCSSM